MIRSDFYRILHRKRLWLIPIATFFLIYLFQEPVPGKIDANTVGYPISSAYVAWSPMHLSQGSHIYNITVFFLLALPTCDLFVEDKQTGLLNQYLIKSSKKRLFFSHLLWAFLFGGAVAVLPLILNVFVTFARVPALPYSDVNIMPVLSDSMIGLDLFYNHFPVYLCVIFARQFIYAGSVALFSVVVCNLSHNKYLGLFFPFFFFFWICDFLSFLLPLPLDLTSSALPTCNLSYYNLPTLLLFGLTMLFTIVSILRQVNQRDAL